MKALVVKDGSGWGSVVTRDGEKVHWLARVVSAWDPATGKWHRGDDALEIEGVEVSGVTVCGYDGRVWEGGGQAVTCESCLAQGGNR